MKEAVSAEQDRVSPRRTKAKASALVATRARRSSLSTVRKSLRRVMIRPARMKSSYPFGLGSGGGQGEEKREERNAATRISAATEATTIPIFRKVRGIAGKSGRRL